MNVQDRATNISGIKYSAQNRKSALVDSAKLENGKATALQDRLYRNIDYAIGRYDWYDELCHRFLNIGIGLSTGSAAVAAVLIQVQLTLPPVSTVLLWLSVVVIFLSGVGLIILYNHGIGRNYPFRKIADIKSWYFVYNLPSASSASLKRNPRKALEQVKSVANDLENYVERWLSVVQADLGFIKEDLEQVFVLQLLQRYKSQQVRRMSSFLTWSFVISALLLAAAIVCLFFPLRESPGLLNRGHLPDKGPASAQAPPQGEQSTIPVGSQDHSATPQQEGPQGGGREP